MAKYRSSYKFNDKESVGSRTRFRKGKMGSVNIDSWSKTKAPLFFVSSDDWNNGLTLFFLHDPIG
jgi:hypothetical protein